MEGEHGSSPPRADAAPSVPPVFQPWGDDTQEVLPPPHRTLAQLQQIPVDRIARAMEQQSEVLSAISRQMIGIGTILERIHPPPRVENAGHGALSPIRESGDRLAEDDRDPVRSPRRSRSPPPNRGDEGEQSAAAGMNVDGASAPGAAARMEKALGTKMPAPLWSSIRDLETTLSADLTKLTATSNRIDRLNRDIEWINNGELPAGTRPYKVPCDVPQLDNVSEFGGQTLSMQVPPGTTNRDLKQLLHLFVTKHNKAVDLSISREQNATLKTNTALDAFTSRCTKAARDYISEINADPSIPDLDLELYVQHAEAAASKIFLRLNLAAQDRDRRQVAAHDKAVEERDKIRAEVAARNPIDQFRDALKAKPPKSSKNVDINVDGLAQDIMAGVDLATAANSNIEISKNGAAPREARGQARGKASGDKGSKTGSTGDALADGKGKGKGKRKGAKGKGKPSKGKGKPKGGDSKSTGKNAKGAPSKYWSGVGKRGPGSSAA